MNTRNRIASAAVLIVSLAGSPITAQVLHVNDTWDDCAIVIDPSLTQEAWHQFVTEVGVVTHLRPLTSAKPLGARRFEVALLNASTRIDDADAAWNDTFSHPNPTHWLFNGDALAIPGLMARIGVSDRVDVGAYFTKNMNSNYGIFGGQVQYSLLNDVERNLAAATRVNAVRLFGPEDLSASVFGLDFVVSKDLWVLSPYVGVAGYLSRGTEHTSKVDLDAENVLGAQGTVGVAYSLSILRLGAEYTVGRVNAYAFKVAFGS
jgi:hypothetical protein